MELVASFYIGISEYLTPTEDLESDTELVNQISKLFYTSTVPVERDYFQSTEKQAVRATMKIGNQSIEAKRFSIDSPTADDEVGLPVLFYIQAHFDIPSDLANEFIDEDDEDLDFPALLVVDNLEFTEALIEVID